MAHRDYQGKVVVITGGGGGLGGALARAWARRGARLALLDLDGAAAETQAARLEARGAQAMGLACDITREEQCRKALLQIVAAWGEVDVLVNNAGITHRSPFASTESQVLRRVMEVNYFGSLYCTQAALPHLLERRGQIVVISSVAGFAPLLGRTGYAASKHALHGLFGSLRGELAPQGVGVLVVCPGFTDTGIAHRALDGDGSITDHPQSTLGRVAQPDEVASAVVRAAARDGEFLVLSTVGRLSWLVYRLCPGLYGRLMARSLRRELERGS